MDERGRCLWRGKCPTDLGALSSTIRRYAPEVERVELATGMLATWLCHGLPVVCMDARQAKAAFSCRVNKTDANDADGLAMLPKKRIGTACEGHTYLLESRRTKKAGPPRRRVDADGRGDRMGEGQ